jgi:hypothetical protein
MICRSPTAGRCLASALAVTLAIAFAPARANDSSAAMAAGGIELVKHDQVRMVSEVLRIAPRLVEVDYLFENTGTTDITTLVAFPLPGLDQAAAYNSPLNIPFGQHANFVGFQVWIDGTEIKPDVEVRAFNKDVDITAEIKRLGVDPVNPGLDRPGVAPTVIDSLRSLDAIIANKLDTFATWTTRVSFHWQQTFLRGSGWQCGIAIGRSMEIFMSPASPSGLLEPDTRWCPDNGFWAAEARLFGRQREAAAKNKDRSSSEFSVNYDNVQYALKTGANWKGAIGRFELQIDKGGADHVSTCPIPGLTLQRAPYGFNAVATDYMPVSNLDILFVSGHFFGRPDGSEIQAK